MDDLKQELKSMLYAVIDDNDETAQGHLHNYLVAKTKEIAGFGQQTQQDTFDENE